MMHARSTPLSRSTRTRMKRMVLPALLLLLVAAPALASNSIVEQHDPEEDARMKVVKKAPFFGPVPMTPAEADSVIKPLAKDRADPETWRKSAPTSYLAAIARRDFGDLRAITVGSDPSNTIRLADSTITPHHLRVSVVGDSFRVDCPDTNSTFYLRGEQR